MPEYLFHTSFNILYHHPRFRKPATGKRRVCEGFVTGYARIRHERTLVGWIRLSIVVLSLTYDVEFHNSLDHAYCQ